MTKRPLTAARSTKHVLREIGCPYLSLYRGDGYWYFTYDDIEGRGIYETQSVCTMRLSDLSLEDWVGTGKSFVETVEKDHTQ